MSIADSILSVNNDLPIRTELPVHSGKVRSVYWLTEQDSHRLIEDKAYPVPIDTPLAIMVISDRISAFDCIWHGKDGMLGVPGKGAALNAISNHWFTLFKQQGLADSHILDIPHPFVWIVQKAKPVMIEAICRQYITGSMWRAYEKGEREFCGIVLEEGLHQDYQLANLLMTPSTKGILKGIPDVPEADDVNISRQNILDNYSAFNFEKQSDVALYEKLLTEGKSPLRKAGQLDNRGSHFYLALYWAEALVNQNDDQELVVKFKPLFESLSANESKIMTEIDSTQGKAIDIGGYYYPCDALLSPELCRSATFNEIIAAG